MSQHSLPLVDFTHIRTHEGSQHKGFEEFAVQLFRESQPISKNFYRVNDAGGDGGVEAFSQQRDETIVGMQAKYFSKLGQTQWSNLDKSIRTALKTHTPKLSSYYIYASCDRPKDTKSWGNYLKKWNQYALELGYQANIEYIWLGKSEICHQLMSESMKPLLHYWFGAERFSKEWLLEKFSVAKKQIDQRYTPDMHVKTSTELQLEAFLLTDHFKQLFLKKFRKLVSVCRKDLVRSKNIKKPKELKELSILISTFATLIEKPLDTVIRKDLLAFLEKFLTLRKRAYKKHLNPKRKNQAKGHAEEASPYHIQFDILDNLYPVFSESLSFIEKYLVYEFRFLLVLGKAGSGKSHLLTRIVEGALQSGQPCLLFTGEQFSSPATLQEQICNILAWNNGIDSLLSALDSAGRIKGKPAIIAIDAINETAQRRLWSDHLYTLAGLIKNYRNIRFLISCRSDFVPLILPASLKENRDQEWARIEQVGFDLNLFEAVNTYFHGYSVSTKQFPPLLVEFKNPLFLKTLCEAYQGQEIPEGKYTFVDVMEKRLQSCCELIARAIGCPSRKTRSALAKIAHLIAENSGNSVEFEKVEKITEAVFSNTQEDQSLYRHLLSNRILFETFTHSHQNDNHSSHTVVRFPYERFSDYFIAEQILRKFDSLTSLRQSWSNEELPNQWIEHSKLRSSHRGIIKMMAILIPEKYGVEFIQLFSPSKYCKQPFYNPILIEDFMESLAWRSTQSIGENTHTCIHQVREFLSIEEYFDYRLRFITIVGHPYNAEELHCELRSLELRDRETTWTIPIANLSNCTELDSVDMIIRWAFNVPKKLVSDDQAWLVALFLSWIFSSNNRLLRRRASIALIRLLDQRTHLAERLIQEFHHCNDAYVVERVYAVACGVGLREHDLEKLSDLSNSVYQKMFAVEEVPAHLLQRDYALTIIERANYLGILSEGIQIERCRPPYKTKWPLIISEKIAKNIEESDGWSEIKDSLETYYGDFGNYIMSPMVHYFSEHRLIEPSSNGSKNDEFKAIIARRYILGRIRDLGWEPNLFKEYEDRINCDRMTPDQEENKIERISKKYQWIALYEFLAYLADHFWIKPDYHRRTLKTYQGAWEAGYRDFDPSHPPFDPVKSIDNENDESHSEQSTNSASIKFPDPFADSILTADREAWVAKLPDDYRDLFKVHKLENMSGRWLCLSGHYNWREERQASHDEAKEGTLKMWNDVRCWLVPKVDYRAFLESIHGIRFYGGGCHNPKLYDRWIGEYPWGLKMPGVEKWFQEDQWGRFRKSLDGKCYQTCCEIDDQRPDVFPILPSPLALQIMGLEWTREDYSYRNQAGEIQALYVPLNNPKMAKTGLLVVNEDAFLQSCWRSDFVPLWATLCEKSCYSFDAKSSIVKIRNVNQRVYRYASGNYSVVHKLDYQIPLYN